MKLAAYLRVSTAGQAEDGFGLDVQRETIETWAREHGHTVSGWYQDAGISGSNGFEDRVGLGEALAAVRSCDGLVIARLDRLARDLVLQETLLAEFGRSGVVCSTSASEQAVLTDDPRDPSRQLIRQILGAVAQYERSMIRLRLDAGRERKHAAGGYAYGAPGYGYEAVDGELVPIPGEQKIIAYIRSLRRKNPPVGWGRIAKKLNKERIPTQRGAQWHADSVRRIALRD